MGVFPFHTRRGQPAAGPVLPVPGKLPLISQERWEGVFPLGSFPAPSMMVLPPHESPPVSQVCYPFPLKEFSKLSVAKCLKRSLYVAVFRPLTILATFLWTHLFVNVPLNMGPAALDMVHQMLSTSSKYSDCYLP